MSLRQRLLSTFAPLLLLLLILGAGGLTLLHNLGRRAEAILRENYDSIQAMVRFGAALIRVDQSFQDALAGEAVQAKEEFAAGWSRAREQLAVERANITILPEEPRLVEALEAAAEAYFTRGQQFFAAEDAERRRELYRGAADAPGLRELRRRADDAAAAIARLNHETMEAAHEAAKQTASKSLWVFGGGFAVLGLLALTLVAWTVRAILLPVADVTAATQAIREGRLLGSVPEVGPEELRRLAAAFNAMTQELREYRQTNLERLLRSQRTAQAAIDSIPDPVVVVDVAQQVELSNRAAQAAFGLGAGRDGAGSGAWLPPDQLREPLQAALRRRVPLISRSFDEALALKFGAEERFYLPEIQPICGPDGAALGATVLFQDVTRFRLLDRLKTDLVATTSHEFKTPLTSLRLAIHILLEEKVGVLNPKQTELLVDARSQAERLLALVDELLALARLEDSADALRREPLSAADLLRAAADAVAARAADQRISLQVQAPPDLPPLHADGMRLGHALNNLLINALNHTAAGGEIVLSAQRQDGTLRLTVADTGVGIAPEHLPHLFTRFYRVPGDAASTGSGLGLAIVREIVEAHGGSVRCTSAMGRGARFDIDLPLSPKESA